MGQAIASTSIWQFQKTEISIAKGHAVMEEKKWIAWTRPHNAISMWSVKHIAKAISM